MDKSKVVHFFLAHPVLVENCMLVCV